MMLFSFFIFTLYISCLRAEIKSPPHIIVIYADDLGWNDVSYHGSPQIPTPNIDALAMNGIVLENYYAEWLCTPSRAAFLTGKYPMRYGLWHAIAAGERLGLNLNETLLPEHLKSLGYATHMVGKWHLGYFKYDYFPTRRGFDSFFGYMNGLIDYYDYVNHEETYLPNQSEFVGIDLFHDTTPVREFRGKYATYAFTNRAKKIIMNHDSEKPLFLYLAHLAAHAGFMKNITLAQQAPSNVISQFKYIKNIERRIHAATVSILDQSVGVIFKTLQLKGMLENSIFLFLSDNGGETDPDKGGHGSNYPLRGNKASYWEGGVHVPAIAWSPLFNLKEPRLAKDLFHVTDWMPTLYHAAGGNPDDLGPTDGIDTWNALTEGSPFPRTDVLNTLDPVWNVAAYRSGDLKLVNGSNPVDNPGWYGPLGSEKRENPSDMQDWVFKNGSQVMDVLKENCWWINDRPEEIYELAAINCTQPVPNEAYGCNPGNKPCLFNITTDPCEYQDIASENPEIVQEMMAKIENYLQQASTIRPYGIADSTSDPMCHNFTYVPWLEPEYYNACDYAEDGFE